MAVNIFPYAQEYFHCLVNESNLEKEAALECLWQVHGFYRWLKQQSVSQEPGKFEEKHILGYLFNILQDGDEASFFACKRIVSAFVYYFDYLTDIGVTEEEEYPTEILMAY